MQDIDIKKEDVLKQIYFILSLVQKLDKPMHSRNGSKQDYMGGIIDRFINTLPESVIFEKILFPKLAKNKKIELIRDFYSYSPEEAKIAPDLLGIKVDNDIIPFVEYDEGWRILPGCPQVEIKTLKEKQYMLSLVNQGYEKSYLIFVESNFNVDYLMPFINEKYFGDEIYNEIMLEVEAYNEKLIKSDINGYVKPIKKVDFDNDTLGSIKILCITKTKNFIKKANLAKKGVSPEVIRKIEYHNVKRKIDSMPLQNFCDEIEEKYYRFNDNWYTFKDKEGTIRRPKDKVITLDFYCSDISSVEFLKMNKDNFYIRAKKNVILNGTKLKVGDYKLELYKPFDRDNTPNNEYFMDKLLLSRVDNYEKSLLNDIKEKCS